MRPTVPNEDSSRCGIELDHLFGFNLDVDSWLCRVRTAESPRNPGRIGPYEVLGVIGSGGQGIVYKVRQPRTGREIALKRLSAGAFATPAMRARFDREVEAAAALDHPNIVTVFGSETIDDQLVLAMQLVDGTPIDRWAAPPYGSRHDIREILAAFQCVCSALQHAHQRGIIHRDLKPSNILIDRNDRPQVLDFGLAKFHLADSSSISLTEPGAVVGTPIFAAPELLSGDLRDIDVRCDVYALGAVLYNALTGRAPHEPDADLVRMIAQVRDREPPSPESIDPRIDRELDSIIRKAMSKERERRYESVSAFSEDIRRYLGGEAVAAHPPSVPYRVRKFLRLHRGTVSAFAGLITILVTATIVVSIYYFRAERELKSSVLANRRQASLLQFVTDILVQADPGQAGKPDATLRSAVSRAREQFEKNAGQYEPAVAAPLQKTLAGIFLALGSPREALPLAEASVKTYRELGPEGKQGLHEALIDLGTALKETGRLSEAEAALRESIALGESLSPDQPAPNANTVVQLLQILDARGDTAGALALARDQYERLRPVATEFAQPFAMAINSLGLRVPNNPPDFEGVRLARESLAATEAAWGKDHRETAVVLSNLGNKLREAGQYNESFEAQRKALAMMESINGLEHPGTMKARLRLGLVQVELGQLPEAVENLNKVIAFKIAHDGDTSPGVAEALRGLAGAQTSLGDFLAAEATCRKVIAMFPNATGVKPIDLAQTQRNLAIALKGQGRFDEAEALLLSAYNSLSIESSMYLRDLLDLELQLTDLYDSMHTAQPNLGFYAKAAEWRGRLNSRQRTTQPAGLWMDARP